MSQESAPAGTVSTVVGETTAATLGRQRHPQGRVCGTACLAGCVMAPVARPVWPAEACWRLATTRPYPLPAVTTT
jgi:hypothetical protein